MYSNMYKQDYAEYLVLNRNVPKQESDNYIDTAFRVKMRLMVESMHKTQLINCLTTWFKSR